jgi:hypothetical protein
MSKATKYALTGVTALLVIVGVLAGAWGINTWQIHRSQQQWCSALDLLTQTVVTPPADPKTNPSREGQYQLYTDFVDIKHRFGC